MFRLPGTRLFFLRKYIVITNLSLIYALLILLFPQTSLAEFTESQKADLRVIFNEIDLNKDGKYNIDESWKMYERKIRPVMKATFKKAIAAKDKNGDNALQPNEYPIDPKIFAQQDENGDGNIVLAEVLKYMDRENKKQFVTSFNSSDFDKDGFISWNEYLKYNETLIKNLAKSQK